LVFQPRLHLRTVEKAHDAVEPLQVRAASITVLASNNKTDAAMEGVEYINLEHPAALSRMRAATHA
jgi:hypothetical protein